MGNNQGSQQKRDGQRQRAWSGGGSNTLPTGGGDDGCPVQVKIAKSSQYLPSQSTPSMQFADTHEYPVVFKWHGTTATKSVYVSGSWDSWKRKIPLVRSTHDFTTIVNLCEGRHEYKYLVDGKWQVEESIAKTDNRMGTQNNVIAIDQADFEVFDALDRDLASSNAGEAMRKMSGGGPSPPSHDTPNDRELEKLKQFTQELPERRDFERAQNPPVLPPHLLQVILNKDTPVQCDPNVLPEPNHVMLNHLYALSIKDGVMVLSATHRYRKKYVTTLLYKPI